MRSRSFPVPLAPQRCFCSYSFLVTILLPPVMLCRPDHNSTFGKCCVINTRTHVIITIETKRFLLDIKICQCPITEIAQSSSLESFISAAVFSLTAGGEKVEEGGTHLFSSSSEYFIFIKRNIFYIKSGDLIHKGWNNYHFI